ncbi:hypothetical protein ACMFMF_009982 [Clarireedia jacksonii]
MSRSFLGTFTAIATPKLLSNIKLNNSTPTMSNDMNYSSIARYNGRLHKGAELHNVSALIVHDTQSAKNWKSHEVCAAGTTIWADEF